jgi:hypothetical protein
VLLAFNDAGTGDEEQLRATDGNVLDREWHGVIIRFQGFKVEWQARQTRREVSCLPGFSQKGMARSEAWTRG